jgi:ADP-heptose:LPS heptosyltransferase
MDQVLKIGVSLGGSLGDVLNGTSVVYGLKRKFPNSEITFYINRHPELLRDNRSVNTIKVVNPRAWEQVKKEIPKYDIFCEVKYAVKYFFSERGLQLKEVRELKEFWEERFNKYYAEMFSEFLSNINRVNKYCTNNYMTAYQLRAHSSALDIDGEEEQFLSVMPQDYEASSHLNGMRIVVINNSGIYGSGMTKSWTVSGWIEVIKTLKRYGVYVVQAGKANDYILPGVNETFFGHTIHETAALIKRAKFCIFIENGLTHVAKAVGTKSIVLFGPTPIDVFGYKENINLRGPVCTPCWWSLPVKDWNTYCNKTGKNVSEGVPPCQASLSFVEVNKAVEQMLINTGIATKKGLKNAKVSN